MDASFYPPKKNDGKIVAFADIGVAVGVIVKGFRILRSEKGLRAAVPSKSFAVEGKTRWVPLVVFSSPEIRQEFLATLLDHYQRWERGRAAARKTGEAETGETAPSHPPANELVE